MEPADNTSPAWASSRVRSGLLWAGCGVLGLALYLLSTPPLVILVTDARPAPMSGMPPPWLKVYVLPADWLYFHTPPLQEPMRTYSKWCSRMIRGR